MTAQKLPDYSIAKEAPMDRKTSSAGRHTATSSTRTENRDLCETASLDEAGAEIERAGPPPIEFDVCFGNENSHIC